MSPTLEALAIAFLALEVIGAIIGFVAFLVVILYFVIPYLRGTKQW